MSNVKQNKLREEVKGQLWLVKGIDRIYYKSVKDSFWIGILFDSEEELDQVKSYSMVKYRLNRIGIKDWGLTVINAMSDKGKDRNGYLVELERGSERLL